MRPRRIVRSLSLLVIVVLITLGLVSITGPHQTEGDFLQVPAAYASGVM
jgi:hypothetical protein